MGHYVTMVRRSPRRTAAHAKPPTAAARRVRRTAIAIWAAVTAADTTSTVTGLPWLPVNLHGLALAAALALTMLAIHLHREVPIRAAVLDGMLWEREHPHATELLRAVGDDTGAAGNVLPLQRPAGTDGRHRPRPRR